MDCVAEDSAQNANMSDMVVLEVKSLYLYTVATQYLVSLLLPSNLSMHTFRAKEDSYSCSYV